MRITSSNRANVINYASLKRTTIVMAPASRSQSEVSRASTFRPGAVSV